MPAVLPSLPYAEFPLRPHRNGQWFKSVWNPRSKRSEQYYFGGWKDDPSGDRALNDPDTGWLARRNSIRAGTDNTRIAPAAAVVTVGELMAQFLTFNRGRVSTHELAARTLGDYIREVGKFVAFMKPAGSKHAIGKRCG